MVYLSFVALASHMARLESLSVGSFLLSHSYTSQSLSWCLKSLMAFIRGLPLWHSAHAMLLLADIAYTDDSTDIRHLAH